MKIKLTLSIDGSEVTRNYEADAIDEIDWEAQVTDIADTILDGKDEEQAILENDDKLGAI